ncbi:MAG: branched-chain amino acid transport system II carrier protein [Candidatus Anaerobiospirillum merdipullorum]|uniref:Branched-chain amino acid transport system carrier protein n=1 Tax=Candidatus Anaerobiospirillum merdipullorum TaxID=2838450 RepID=A0A9E2KND4_9GAMM|nr:branched-chain amino acid transport system II carrier protein [Candidatus Anaerobiospirillum merdipullorum]
MQVQKNYSFIPIGLMLFALFFGAGNLIFPASMGQVAGYNVWWAVLGFCVTGVGLPLLAVIAIGYSGKLALMQVASRVHPYYALFYTVISYMAIGPCFAVPRTGTVSYEIAIRPFLGANPPEYALAIFLLFFFLVTGWLSATPTKLVDRIGKFLTPALVLTLVIYIVKSFISPLGEPQEPSAAYATPVKAVIQGILDGYNTLDAIAALVFASLVIKAVQYTGINDKREVTLQVYKSGFVAGPLLAIIYIFIAKIGSESVGAIGLQETGAPILAETAKIFFGQAGAILLAVMVLLACLTTSIGLITCCATFMRELTGKLPYVAWVVIFTVISYLIGLFGLKTIIVSTIPVLMFIYPLCVAIVFLILTHKLFGGRRCVYAWTMAFTLVMATHNGLQTAQIALGGLDAILTQWLPLHRYGLGWIPFALCGFVIGLVHKSLVKAAPVD